MNVSSADVDGIRHASWHIARTWDGQPIASAEQVTIELVATQDGIAVAIDAPFHDDPAPPSPATPGSPTPGLWNYEVVELFIASVSTASASTRNTAYTECEIGPHGHALLLRLADVRQVDTTSCPCALTTTLDRVNGRWTAALTIGWQDLPSHEPGALVGNAYAIHGCGDGRRYLAAVPVPGKQPDFHQPARFAALFGPNKRPGTRRR